MVSELLASPPNAITERDSEHERRWQRCPVCGSTTIRAYVRFDELDFAQCSHCGVVFKSREAGAVRTPDFYEQGYFEGRRSGRDRRFEHRVRKAMRHLIACQQFTDARSMLDIGCSLGYVVEGGRRLGLISACTDISRYAVEHCRALGHDARVGQLEALPFEDARFDIAVMKHVLEHTPEPQRALAEVRRVLRPGGVALVIVPNLHYWKGLWQRRRGRYFRPDDLGRQHYVYYGRRALRQLLDAAGFDVTADSKALFRGRLAAGRSLRWCAEVLRLAGLLIWQGAARMLWQRRELFVIATRRDQI